MAEELKNLDSSADEAGRLLVATLVKNLRAEGKVATGDLIKSINYNIIKDANGLLLDITGNPSLGYVDRGRPKGIMPPVSPIVSWIKAKGIKISGKTEEQAGFMIASGIKKNGIVATNVIEESLNEVIAQVQYLLAEGAQQDIALRIDSELKELFK